MPTPLRSNLARLLTAGAAALLACLSAPADTLHLKDGRVLEGRVEREGDNFVYFATKVGGIERVEFFTRAQIDKVVKDAPKAETKKDAPAGAPGAPSPERHPAKPDGAAPAPAAPAPSARAGEPTPSPSPDAARIAFISLGEPPLDMVGPYMNSGALKQSVELLEPEKPEIVVLLINSGGGALFEIQKLSDVIENEIKPKYRTVAWIHSAISAAAMTAHSVEEIYFMPKGNYGACTGFSMTGPGQAKAMEGRPLEQVIYMMEKISERGKKDPKIMRSMQIEDPLSCDIDADGVVRWRGDDQGQYLVNPKGRILTFNANDAMKYKFAKGIAATKDELARLLVGDREWVEVGAGADRHQEDYRKTTREAELSIGRIQEKLDAALQEAMTAQGTEAKGKKLGEARRWLSEARAWARRSPGVATYFAPNIYFRTIEEIMRKIQAGETVTLPVQLEPDPDEEEPS